MVYRLQDHEGRPDKGREGSVDASQLGRLAGEGDTLLLSGYRRTDLRPEALTWILFSFKRFKAPQLVSALTVTPRRTSC